MKRSRTPIAKSFNDDVVPNRKQLFNMSRDDSPLRRSSLLSIDPFMSDAEQNAKFKNLTLNPNKNTN